MHKLKIACIGEAMFKFRENPEEPENLVREAAGDALVTAVYLCRLLRERADIHFVTQMGDESNSGRMIREWQALGLKTDLINQVPGAATGCYSVELDEEGNRHLYHWRVDSPFRQLFLMPGSGHWPEELCGFDLVYYSGETLAALSPESREILLRLSGQVRSCGGRVAFDGSFKPDIWEDMDSAADWVGRGYQGADIALPTYDDDSELAVLESGGVMLNRFLMMGCREVVIKREDEPYFVACDGERHIVDPDSLPTGFDGSQGGDSFNAGYLAARLSGRGGREAALLGHEIAGRAVANADRLLPPDCLSDLWP